MYCVNHPEVNAIGACVGCGKFFCADCMKEIKGKYRCNNCIEELIEDQNKKIEKLETSKQQPMVFMNAGGGGGAASSSSSSSSSGNGYMKKYNRSKVTAALLAVFFGGLGVHKFYLGRNMQGLLYLFFCWTFIPSLIAFGEFLIYLLSSQDSFDRKYNY